VLYALLCQLLVVFPHFTDFSLRITASSIAKVSTRRRTVDDAERLIKCMQTMPRNFNNNDMIEEVLGVFIISCSTFERKQQGSEVLQNLQEAGQRKNG
jgi:hypothetical protein